MTAHLRQIRFSLIHLLIILSIFFTLSAVILGAMIYNRSTVQAEQFTNTFTVTINDNGFSPNSIRISQGDRVRFVNKSTTQHWVASDNHPLHELYPELDAKQPLAKNEYWEFTFDKAGSWGIHDHLNPSLHGKVIVLPVKGPRTQTASTNDKSALWLTIKAKIKEQGAAAAWKSLVSQKETLTSEGLHDIAHAIGQELYKEKGVQSLDICDSSFVFGCYHGVFEEFIQLHGIDNLSEIVSYCQKNQPQVAITCYHGMGHGLLPYYKYQLIPALQGCDKFLSEHDGPYCYRGVFMEFASVFSMKAKKSDPLWPCSTVPDKYKLSCFNYQMIYLGYLGDFAAADKACQTAGSKEYQTECIAGAGHTIAQTSSYNTTSIKEKCSQMTIPSRYVCIIAAAQESVFQGQDNKKIEKELCTSLPDTYKEDCSEKAAFQAQIRQ